MRTLPVRMLLALLAVGLCFLPTFGFCYHADGGTCIETRAGECCEDSSTPGAPAADDCPDCTDVLASTAIPMSRPELSDGAGARPLLVLSLSSGAQVVRSQASEIIGRGGAADRSSRSALLSLPLRC